jgi:hypothetical protein
MTVLFFGERERDSSGYAIGNETVRSTRNPLSPKTGRKPRKSYESGFWLGMATYYKSFVRARI